MARILNFGDEEKRKVGLISSSRWSFVPFFGRSGSSTGVAETQEQAAQQKVRSYGVANTKEA